MNTHQSLQIVVSWIPEQLQSLALPNSHETIVVVVDILRATTCMSCALERGAEAILPADSLDEARHLSKNHPDALLCGERNHERPEDFHLGNSPGEFLKAEVFGKKLIHATTNGTRALLALRRSKPLHIYAGSFRCLSALSACISQQCSKQLIKFLTIAASGTLDGASYEDLLFGGALLERLNIIHPLVSLWRGRPYYNLADNLALSRNGRALAKKGRSDDIAQSATLDTTDLIPQLCQDDWIRAQKLA